MGDKMQIYSPHFSNNFFSVLFAAITFLKFYFIIIIKYTLHWLDMYIVY